MEEVESEEEVRWGLTNPEIDNLFKHEDRIVYSNLTLWYDLDTLEWLQV